MLVPRRIQLGVFFCLVAGVILLTVFIQRRVGCRLRDVPCCAPVSLCLNVPKGSDASLLPTARACQFAAFACPFFCRFSFCGIYLSFFCLIYVSRVLNRNCACSGSWILVVSAQPSPAVTPSLAVPPRPSMAGTASVHPLQSLFKLL